MTDKVKKESTHENSQDCQLQEYNLKNIDDYIQGRYKFAINYYWTASKNNKKWYKTTRSMIIILGSLVTLVSSLSTSHIFSELELKDTMLLITPILAFFLTIVAGFSQSFQWGSTWQNMILTAQHLQKEYDKYLVTPIEKRDFIAESDKLNDFVITETKGFFDRMLGIAKFNKLDKQLNNLKNIDE